MNAMIEMMSRVPSVIPMIASVESFDFGVGGGSMHFVHLQILPIISYTESSFLFKNVHVLSNE